jgi:WD40 repeat protein
VDANITDVSSIHWNAIGDKLVTSSSDCYSRVWKVDEGEAKVEEECKGVYRLKNFKMMLMMSKFNKGNGDYIASGGHSTTVTVWNPETGKVLVTFDHAENEPGFVC